MNKYLEKLAVRKEVSLLLQKAKELGKVNTHTHIPTLKGALKSQSKSSPKYRLTDTEFFKNRQTQRNNTLASKAKNKIKEFKSDMESATGFYPKKGVVAGYGTSSRKGSLKNNAYLEKALRKQRTWEHEGGAGEAAKWFHTPNYNNNI
jgi:hypothetical protein